MRFGVSKIYIPPSCREGVKEAPPAPVETLAREATARGRRPLSRRLRRAPDAFDAPARRNVWFADRARREKRSRRRAGYSVM
jgi:hypothetical protein